MELDRIEKLLEKYVEAKSTAEEENLLRRYFSGDDIAEHLKPYIPMFRYFTTAKEERFTGEVPLHTLSSGNKRKYIRWASVAAVIFMVFGLYLGSKYKEQREAEYAYEETRKALNLLAENLGKGTQKMAYLTEFEEAKQKIYNHE
ncbi:MAG: hypothetical protein AAFX53_01175 [Bacteroidota bacterium]